MQEVPSHMPPKGAYWPDASGRGTPTAHRMCWTANHAFAAARVLADVSMSGGRLEALSDTQVLNLQLLLPVSVLPWRTAVLAD